VNLNWKAHGRRQSCLVLRYYSVSGGTSGNRRRRQAEYTSIVWFPNRYLHRRLYKRITSVCGLGQRGQYSDSLLARWSGDRIPVGSRFAAPVQSGPGAHPASYTMGTGSFPEVKWPRRGVNHPSHPTAKLKREWLHGRL
jgi:hypothetical protein